MNLMMMEMAVILAAAAKQNTKDSTTEYRATRILEQRQQEFHQHRPLSVIREEVVHIRLKNNAYADDAYNETE